MLDHYVQNIDSKRVRFEIRMFMFMFNYVVVNRVAIFFTTVCETSYTELWATLYFRIDFRKLFKVT